MKKYILLYKEQAKEAKANIANSQIRKAQTPGNSMLQGSLN